MRKMASLIAQCGNSNNTKVKLPGRSVNVWGRDLSGTLGGAGGTGGLLAVQRGGAWHFPLYDGGGNITAYISESGAVAATYAYGPYGETVSHTGQDFDYRFSTKPYNEVLNTYRFAYREYAPDTGRWLSQDPIFERGGYNLYCYCGNDPVNAYDPLGLLKVFPVEDSPNYATMSDFWFGVYLEFEKGDGPWLIIRKEIKEDLCDCNNASVQSKPDNPPRKDFLMFSVSSASSWQHISNFEINGKRTFERPYFELASLANYSEKMDKKGEVFLKFTVGVTKKLGASVKYEKNVGASYSPEDKEHSYNTYYKDNDEFDFNFSSSATLEMKLKIECGKATNFEYYKISGLSHSYNHRLDKNGQKRKVGKENEEGVTPFHYINWYDEDEDK